MSNICKKLKGRYIIAIVYTILLTIIWLFSPIRVPEKEWITEQPVSNVQLIPGLYDSTECKQYFDLPMYSTLEAIDIQFATYNNGITAKEISLSLYSGKDELLYQTSADASELADNAYYRFSIEKGISNKSGSYYFIITGNEPKEDSSIAPAVWCSDDKINDLGEVLYINGEQQPYSINAVYQYSNIAYSQYANYVWQLLLGIFCICCLPDILDKLTSSHKLVKLFYLIINVVVLEIMVESVGFSGIEMKPLTRLATYFVLVSFILLFSGIFGNGYLAIMTVDIAMVIFAIFNYFVMRYRGAPIIPSDIFSVKTLNTVVDTYVISFDYMQKIVLIWLVLILAYCIRLFVWERRLYRSSSISIKKKAITRMSAVLLGVVGLIALSSPTVLKKGLNIDYYVWARTEGYYNNGPIMDFMVNIQFVRIEKPKNYSLDLAKEYLEPYENDAEDQQVSLEKYPNVILIMNEALADFNSYENEEIQFTEDPLPFIHSLEENTIKGYCYVSVFGSGTANSEMEALTGHTMAYFPSGSIVYQQYAQPDTPGLTSSLKELGYKTIAMHPFTKSNWNRIDVYDSMKFDEYLAEEDFANAEYVRWISDKATYDKIIELYEDKDDKERLFILDITMQGHGGYTNNTPWENPIEVVSNDFPLTKEYLSSSYVSDQAFQYLIEYFSEQEEPTVVLMFGDHQPAVEDEFFELLLGKPLTDLNLEELQKRFCTPYVLWTNFEIESNLCYDISANQIASLIKETAEMPLTAYDRFIQEFSKTIPVINANGFCDNMGNWYVLEEPGEYEELIHKYNVIQYAIYCDGLISE